MCGIAGIIQARPGPYQLSHLKRMTDALAHRGPDGEGHWENKDQKALLGHRRLSIIDLSDAGRQPMEYAGRYQIVHNGEIYNYRELKDRLRNKGYHFRSQSDTEVILAAWDCWKEKCLQELDGMFAFAIWDEQESYLFAARDRFGEKPFYYSFSEGNFLFASEMKALWSAGIQKTPNLKMLFNFITIGYTGNPDKPGETFYEQISQLPPASWLGFHPGENNCTVQSYWSVEPVEKDRPLSDTEAEEKFRELFSESVNRRLRSDVPVGASLSGGLDSSSVVATVMRENPGLPFRCFTASFPGFEKDELAFAQQMTAQYALPHEIIRPRAEDLLNDWEILCRHQEEPFGSASIFVQYKIYEQARQTDTKVLLDGQGADEILAGYPRYFKWYWQELFRKGKLSGRRELAAARALGVTEPFTWKNKIAAWFPSFATIVMERQYLLKSLAHPGLTREFVQQQSREAYYTPPDHFTLNGVLHFNCFVHGLQELLRFADRNAMAHGREVRLPFLSHMLVEFLFSLPGHFKIREGRTKWLLRQSMQQQLPASIAWRSDKVGFEPPQQEWMQHPRMQEAIHAAREKLVAEKILRPEVLARPVKPHGAHDAGEFDWRYFSAALLFK